MNKNSITCLMVAGIWLCMPVFCAFADASWEPVTVNGFGKDSNNGISCMMRFGDELLVGTENYRSGCDLYRVTEDGKWIMQNENGFTDPANTRLSCMIYFKDILFAGTMNTITGAALYESRDNGETWRSLDIKSLGEENYRVSSMSVFRDRLYLGMRNPHGAVIGVTSDGVTFTTAATRGIEHYHNIDIPVLFPAGQTLLIAGTENADIMTTESSGAQIYFSEDGDTWMLGYKSSSGSRAAAVVTCVQPEPNGYVYAGCRSLFTGRVDRGMILRGQVKDKGIEFEREFSPYGRLPGIICMTTVQREIIAGCSNARLIKINPSGTLQEVVLPPEIIAGKGTITAIEYKSPWLYIGITYPTFPVKGAGVYRSNNFEVKEMTPVQPSGIVSSGPTGPETRASNSTWFLIPGIVVLICMLLYLILKMRKR